MFVIFVKDLFDCEFNENINISYGKGYYDIFENKYQEFSKGKDLYDGENMFTIKKENSDIYIYVNLIDRQKKIFWIKENLKKGGNLCCICKKIKRFKNNL